MICWSYGNCMFIHWGTTSLLFKVFHFIFLHAVYESLNSSSFSSILKKRFIMFGGKGKFSLPNLRAKIMNLYHCLLNFIVSGLSWDSSLVFLILCCFLVAASLLKTHLSEWMVCESGYHGHMGYVETVSLMLICIRHT